MSAISDKLKSIYGSDNTYTILELLREMTEALKEYEGVIVKDIDLTQTDDEHIKMTVTTGDGSKDYDFTLPRGIGIQKITIQEVK